MTRFSPALLDEIRDRLPISQVIGRRVQWDRRKSNAARGDYWACCPFHGEKTASFHCEDRKGRYHCFGCGVTGDHFRFLTELEGLSFPEAVERLAAEAGVALPAPDSGQAQRDAERIGHLAVMEMAAAWFEERLQAAEGARARAYLRERAILPATQKVFRLGYAPENRNALKEHLAARGVTREAMEACGLLVHGPDIPVSFDRFRDRLMFPIENAQGKVIAFGGRAMSADAQAKYLNSPETGLFHKSDVLFNLARARRAARDKGEAIAVEGYVDVIALHQAGIAHTVAPLGTALTENQLALLWRMAAEPVLCFDGDPAGQKAAWRAIDMLLPQLAPGRTARFALLPAGQDPDDLVRAEGGEAMRAVIAEAVPLSEMLWRRETATASFDTPEQRAGLEARLRGIAATIRDDAIRRHYLQDFARRLAGLFGAAPAAARRNPPGAKPPASRLSPSPNLLASPLVTRRSARMPLREAVLVATVANHPAILRIGFEEFAELGLANAAAARLQKAILATFAEFEAEGRDCDAAGLRERLVATGAGEILDQADRQLRDARIWQGLPDAAFEDALGGWRQAVSLQLRARHLRRELEAAEAALAADDSEANLGRLVEIRNEIARGDGIEALIDGFGLSSGRPARSF
jgi:DNA primase